MTLEDSSANLEKIYNFKNILKLQKMENKFISALNKRIGFNHFHNINNLLKDECQSNTKTNSRIIIHQTEQLNEPYTNLNNDD